MFREGYGRGEKIIIEGGKRRTRYFFPARWGGVNARWEVNPVSELPHYMVRELPRNGGVKLVPEVVSGWT